jgi:hypothetical protein
MVTTACGKAAHRPTKLGSISEALLNSNSMCLLTPHNLGTRIDPSTGKPTTIDLTIASYSLATLPRITTSQHMGSDHLPLTILLNALPARNTGQPATWIKNDKKWNDWNALIDETLQDANFHSLTNPTEVSSTFYHSIETVNLKFFKLSQPSSHKCEAQCPPWWNDECKAVVCAALKAFRNSHLFSTLRSEWTPPEARKKTARHLNSEKKRMDGLHLQPRHPRSTPAMVFREMHDRQGRKPLSGWHQHHRRRRDN